MSHDVFISYSSKNKATADAICHTLEEKGIRCFIAPRDIPLGKKYGTVIVEAIERCRVVVLVFSGQAAVSPWVESEINVAFSNRRPIIPYKIDDTNLKNYEEFYFLLNNRHWIESYPDYRERFKELVDAVVAITGVKRATPAPGPMPAPSVAPQRVQQPTPPPVPEPPTPRPNKSRRTIAWVVGALLFVCALWGSLILLISSLGEEYDLVATSEQTQEKVSEPAPTPKKAATSEPAAKKSNSTTQKTTSAPKSSDTPRESKAATTEKPAAQEAPIIDYEFCEMVYVEGGTFTMGATSEQGSDADSDETPTHSVTLSPFYIGKYEITQAQWKSVMGDNPSNWKGDNLPVENVSWNDVQEFIRKLNAKTGKKYRLPTEAEWEYAARGGKKSQGYKYSGSNNIDAVAWYDWYTSNSASKPHPVGQKQPNELGIYDMSGNVCEWCQDWYGSYSSSSQTNPTGPSSGSDRVLRGGYWAALARHCSVSNRGCNPPSNRNSDRGFRLVLEKAATTTSAKTTTPTIKTYKVGDYYKVGSKEGVVFEVTSDGRHGKIIALNDLGYLMWSDAKRGCANQGNGWYMPTKDEWQAIYNVKKTLQSTLTNRGNLLRSGFYWSSTEYDASNVWFFDVFEGRLRYADRNNKYINNINTRAVSTF